MIKSTAFRRELQSTWLLLGCAVFGIVASFVLSLEKLYMLQHPGTSPSCSLNPFISCESAISSAQSELFGVPLTLFGIAAYTALFVVGVLMFTKSILSIHTWQIIVGTAVCGLLGVHYLILQSVFVLHVICPWCFGVWLTTPLIFTVLLGLMPLGTLPEQFTALITHRFKLLATWYAALAMLLIITFWDAWTVLL